MELSYLAIGLSLQWLHKVWQEEAGSEARKGWGIVPGIRDGREPVCTVLPTKQICLFGSACLGLDSMQGLQSLCVGCCHLELL